jgi:aspartate/methionine/tyrosine aminotransferase
MLWTKLLARSGLARYLPGVRRLTDGGQDFLHYYSTRTLASPYAELRAAAVYWEADEEPDTINLALGTPLFDLIRSTGTKLPLNRRGYPPMRGLPELRAAVAARLEAQQQLHANPEDEVLITHGVTGAFSVVLDTFVDRGDRVVLFDPCSPMYLFAVRRRRAKVCWLRARMEQGVLRFRHDDLARALKSTRLLVVNVPSNPSGAALALEDVEEIAWWADRHDVLIFCDQAFARYQYDGALASIGTMPSARRRTLTADSVSKGHGLASARVGWLCGHRHLLRPCLLNQALHTPFVPTLCQHIAVSALEQPEEVFEPIRADFAARRRYAFERLQGMGLEPLWPAGGLFLWVKIAGLGVDGRTFAERLYRDHKVLVSPGEFFGPSGRDFIRLSFAAEEGRVREGLSRLAGCVAGLKEAKAVTIARAA